MTCAQNEHGGQPIQFEKDTPIQRANLRQPKRYKTLGGPSVNLGVSLMKMNAGQPLPFGQDTPQAPALPPQRKRFKTLSGPSGNFG
jgi:hypothetical protein